MMRKAISGFFEQHELAWEIFMIILALVFVAIGFLPDLIEFTAEQLSLLDIADWTITGIFALEFIIRISVAHSPPGYLKEHWPDLLAIIPVVRWLRVVRIARIIRLLRLARLVRGLNSIDLLELNAIRFIRLNGLEWMLLTLTLIMLCSSIILYFSEHAVNPKVLTYWDALYASLVTWTTPGYGDIVPITTTGRISGLVLVVSGLVTWGLLIANLAAFLATRKMEARSADPAIAEIQKQFSRLDELSQQELICLRGSVNALLEHKIESTNLE